MQSKRSDILTLRRQWGGKGEWATTGHVCRDTEKNRKHMRKLRKKWRDAQPNDKWRVVCITNIVIEEVLR